MFTIKSTDFAMESIYLVIFILWFHANILIVSIIQDKFLCFI